MGRDKKTFPEGEVRWIARALAAADMNQSRAAEKLRVSTTTLCAWLERIEELHGIDLRTLAGLTAGLKFGKPKTRGDLIREMTDEALAEYWHDKYDAFCVDAQGHCINEILEGRDIPERRCVACVLRWLQEVVKDV